MPCDFAMVEWKNVRILFGSSICSNYRRHSGPDVFAAAMAVPVSVLYDVSGRGSVDLFVGIFV